MGYAFVLAGLAAFGFILELLVVKEELLPRRKDKFSAAIYALKNLILEFH
jgi:hypothetical protein